MTAPRDHLLLRMGAEVFKVCPDPDALLPYLIKNNPLMPVVYNRRIKINVNTGGQDLFLWANMLSFNELNIKYVQYVHRPHC